MGINSDYSAVTTLRVSDADLDKAAALAAKLSEISGVKVSRSAVLRRAVQHGLKTLESTMTLRSIRAKARGAAAG